MERNAVFLHGFGTRYDLPISLALYLYAAAGVVVLSFVLVVVFASERMGERAVRYPRVPLPWLIGVAGAPVVRAAGGAIGVLCLLTVIVTGFWGSADPVLNPSVYLVWIYLWVGMVLFAALVGNLWTYLNPFAALYALLRRLPLPAPRELPRSIGIWPAVALFFAVAWLELASGLASVPAAVAALAAVYTAATLAGMVLFGGRVWLSRCEVFSVLFDIASRFGPFEVEREARHEKAIEEKGDDSGSWADPRIRMVYVRPWGAGLLRPIEAGWDRVAFVILMLSGLAFDGFMATPPWYALTRDLAPITASLGGAGHVVLFTAGLLSVAVLFFAVFMTFMWLVISFGVTRVDRRATVTAFALTLVPIALVYSAAHYYTYLLIQGQALIPLLADPLSRGWDLAPVKGYRPNWALAGASTVWYMQVLLIVIGHVIAVYLAHLRAGQAFRTSRNALLSQYPMLVLMVAYTMTSLWILAQPITGTG